MTNIKELHYQTKMLHDLRERFKRTHIVSEKEKLKKIGISRRLLLEEQYAKYREELYKEAGDDDFDKIVIDVLVNIG